YTPYVPKAMRYVPNLFSVLSLGSIIGYLLGLLPGFPIVIILVLGLLLSGLFLKNTSKLASDTNQLQNTFRQYQKLILKIEEVSFNSVLDRKSTRLNSSHVKISYAVFCLKKKNQC